MRTARRPCSETGSAVIEAKCSRERECLVVTRGPEEGRAAEAALALRQLAVQHPVRDTVRLPRVHQVCARLRGLLLQRDHLLPQTTSISATRSRSSICSRSICSAGRAPGSHARSCVLSLRFSSAARFARPPRSQGLLLRRDLLLQLRDCGCRCRRRRRIAAAALEKLHAWTSSFFWAACITLVLVTLAWAAA